ncbi:MAG TPA: hypothetical protein VFN97_01030 [Actinospica sp.]|nr:hypothetical protein [Actinospica sp.]
MSSSTVIETETRGSTSGPVVLGRLVPPAALLLVGVLGHLAVPGGPARAVLVLPCLFWIPGRALAAALGLGAKTSGQFVTLLSVLFSCVALILAGLLANLVLGHVPLSTLPLWLSGVLLPLNLLERDPVTGLRAALPGVRIAALFTVAFLASGALLWGAVAKLPTTKPSGYMTFYLAGSYTRLQGVMQATAGETLQVPLGIGGAGGVSASDLTVATYVDGEPAGTDAPVRTTGPNTATAQVSVTVPGTAACEHQIRLVLEQGGSQLRAVDFYVQTARKGQGCGDG